MLYFYAATTLAQDAEVVCPMHDGRSHSTAPLTSVSQNLNSLQLSTTIPRNLPINTVSVLDWLSLRKSITYTFLTLFSTLPLVSFLKPD